MDAFYRALEAAANAGEAVVTATIVEARGSTPREAGAKMLIRRDAPFVGTVGGGCGEASVLLDAQRSFEDGRPRLCEIDLTGDINDDSSTNCGGVMRVLIERHDWQVASRPGLADRELIARLCAADAARRPLALVRVVASDRPALPVGSQWLVAPDGALEGEAPAVLAPRLRAAGAAALEAGCCTHDRATLDAHALALYAEPVVPPPELVIVGAGHIAVPLARMARMLDFAVAVVDDRAAFAHRGRFPEADSIEIGAVDEVLRARRIGADSYVVLVTRAHQYDEAALKVVIGSPAAYIGMIGSRRRVREVFRHVEQSGVPRTLLERVHAPIGLDLGARTPAEIAASILAELVQVRARGAGSARAAHAPTPGLVLVRGAGDLATGSALRLHRAGFDVVMTELAEPTAVRRTVAFSEAVVDGTATVEGLRARRASDAEEARAIVAAGEVAVMVDPGDALRALLRPQVVVDARMAKRNLGTTCADAPVVIALGPGFVAARDAHAVIETNRGHALGRVILEGGAEPNTGIPGEIGGRSTERLLRAPADGVLRTRCAIGDRVEAGDVVGEVGGAPMPALTPGIVRGLLRDGTRVRARQKVGDVDPRAAPAHCHTVSDKARSVAGGVLEAVLYLSRTLNPASGRCAPPMSARASLGAPRSSRQRASA